MDKNTALTKNIDPVQSLEIANSFIENLNDGQIAKNFMITNEKGERVFSKSDALATIILGMEVGLNPVTALSLGKDLKPSKIYAIDKGRAFGLSPLESIKLIHVIPNSNGENTIYIGINLVSKRLHESKTIHTLTKDYQPVYSYNVYENKKWVRVQTDMVLDDNGNLLDKFFIVDKTCSQSEIDSAKSENKIFLQRVVTDYVTEWEFKREGCATLTMPYYRSEAIQARVLQVVDGNGAIIQKGKPSWNNHERQMMRNRALIIGARFIAADFLAGVYDIASESENIDESYEDVSHTVEQLSNINESYIKHRV